MLDLLIVLAFVVYAVSAGFRAKKKASESLQEYFLAGRTITGWRAGVSMAATQFGADTPLLVAGLIATGGIFQLWRLWVYGLAFLMLAFVLAVSWRRAGVLTDAELTEIRYSGRGVLGLRVLKALYYGTIMNCVVMAMVLVAAVRIAEIFLPWHAWLPEWLFGPFLKLTGLLGFNLGGSATGLDSATASANNFISILLILAFTTLYSTTGGLRGVITTDVMQFGLALIGTLVYAWVIVSKVGGPGTMTQRVVELYGSERAGQMLTFAPTTGEALLPFLVLIGLQWFFQRNSDGTGYLAQRSMSCKTDRDARIAGVVFAWLQILARSVIWLVIGVGLLVLYPFSPQEAAGDQFAAGREILFITGINDFLPIGIRGLMLTGLLAALASTIDTHLNWGAGYWSNDIYRRLICQEWMKREPDNRELVLVARVSNLLILTLALIVMAFLGSIQTAWFISLLFGAGVGSVLVLRWFWERINLYCELTAIAVSLVVAVFILSSGIEEEWIRLGTMSLVSTVAVVLAAIWTPRTDKAVLQRFYERVKPAGFWGRTALQAGDDPQIPRRKLYRGLGTTAVCSASLFLALIGIGKLVVPAPDQWLLSPWLYIVASAALMPLWLKEAFGSRHLRP